MSQYPDPNRPSSQPPAEPGTETLPPTAVAPQPPPPPPQVGAMVNPFTQPFAEPIATYLLLGAIVLVFGLTLISGLLSSPSETLFRFGATFGPSILQEGQWWRFLTAMFLHGSFAHIIFNGYALYILGMDMERLFGTARYTALYFITGLFGGLASFFVRGMDEFSVGASGAIFGILGMNLAFFAFYRNKLGRFGRERLNRTLQLVGINLIIGILIVRINNLAHVGGLVSGLLFGYLLVPQYFVSEVSDFHIKVVDRASLAQRWWVIVLALVVLFGGFFVAFARWM